MERQVLEMMLLGKTRTEIAAELFISIRTVNFHVSNVYCKLDVHNQMQLVIVAMNHDLHPLFSTAGEWQQMERPRDAPCDAA